MTARSNFHHRAWVVAVDMGYGHQRAAFALRDLAPEKTVISANKYPGIPEGDRALWRQTRAVYEFISRLKKAPVLGDFVFSLMDKVQDIAPFYPKRRPLEPPGFELKGIYKLMEWREWGRHLVRHLRTKALPVVATFPVPGLMAEYWEYEEPVFLVVTDTDAARAWVSLEPKKTKLHYFAPTKRAAERLLQYGVPSDHIFLTGFPLPPLFLGEKGEEALKQDLRRRLQLLDPKRKYTSRYADVVRSYLGRVPPIPEQKEPPTITFAVGGAGAQQDLAVDILKGLVPLLKEEKVRLILVAATHLDAKEKFELAVKEHKASKAVKVVYEKDKEKYFEVFNEVLRETDILWTKPSELSFFAALGIPLVIAPPIGSQEAANQEWLVRLGAGINQLAPEHAADWVADYLDKGYFAEAAMQGYVEGELKGTQNIVRVIQEL